MMKAAGIIGISLGLLAFAGCSDMGIRDESMGPLLTGSVTTQDGNPIEHIQVTLNWEEAGIKETAYTSSEGIFTSAAHLSKGETSLKIILEDIDGEENGGIFETLEETIILLEEEYSESVTENGEVRLQMAFRLNHATL